MKSISSTISFIFLVIVQINCDSKSPFNNETLTKVEHFREIFFVKNSTVNTLKRQFENVIHGENRGRNCLENIEQCVQEDAEFEEVAHNLSPLLFLSMPPFDLSEIPGVSRKCRHQSKIYIEELKMFKLWALKMHDASAKLPSGILNGNVNQLGDFDLCLQSQTRNIKGKYCLASFQVEPPESQYFAGLHTLIQSHFHFKTQLDDPGHRVPRFSSINWALCLPDGCSSRDVELGLLQKVNATDFKVQVRVDREMCQTSQGTKIPKSSIIAMMVFGGFFLLVLAASIYDSTTLGEKNGWISGFSLRKNWKSLVTIDKHTGDIDAIHGIRFVHAVLLVFSHKSMALFFIPYTNRTEMIENVSQPWTVLGRAASLYTDPFILISGTLTAYALLGKLQKTNRINVKEEYISRLLRIIPSLAAVIAFCTFILPWLSAGPMWNQVITQHSIICKRNWWRNLLFIHNYFGFKDMCLTHTHHIGIDTQLFFTSPLLVWILWRWGRKGATFLIFLASLSTVMRYYVTYTMRLSNYVHFGTSIKQLFETADNMYTLPVYRATVYIMGILLGYILRNFRDINLSKNYLQMGNAVALVCICASLFGPSSMGKLGYVYDPRDAAWYAAFAPILWCSAFAWIIFTSFGRHRGPLERFFSWPGFSLWTKISYSVYLTQFPIYFYNVGTTRTADYYGFFSVIINAQEYFCIIAVSIGLTLLFEMPFNNIKNLIYSKKKTSENLNLVLNKKDN